MCQKQFESLRDEMVRLRIDLLNAAQPGKAAADDVPSRMQQDYVKKTAVFRSLNIASSAIVTE